MAVASAPKRRARATVRRSRGPALIWSIYLPKIRRKSWAARRQSCCVLWRENMNRMLMIAAMGSFVAYGHVAAADDAASERIHAALKQVSPNVLPEAERDQLRTMLARSLREQIAGANRAGSAAWAKIDSRREWERFRQEKLAALRNSLGPFPARPMKPRTLITGRIQGDGFQIQNLV